MTDNANMQCIGDEKHLMYDGNKVSLKYFMDVVTPTFQVGDIPVVLSSAGFSFFGHLFGMGGITKG